MTVVSAHADDAILMGLAFRDFLDRDDVAACFS